MSNASPATRDVLRQGMNHLRQKAYAEAEESFGRAVDAAPESATAWLLRGIARAKQGRVMDARTDLNRSLELGPVDVNLHLKAARTFMGMREPHSAIDTLDSALKAVPEHAKLWDTRFQIAMKAGWYHEGFRSLLAAIECEPGNLNRRTNAARLYHNLRDNEEALSQIEKAAAIGEKTAELAFLAVDVLHDMERSDEALAWLGEAVELSDKSEETLLLATKKTIDLGAMEEAFERARRAAEMAPRSTDALMQLATLELWAGQLSQVRELTARILDIDPDLGPAHRLRAACAVMDDDLDTALGDLEVALERDPQDGEALLWRGEIKRKREDFDGAVVDIDMGIIHSDGYALPGHMSRLVTILETQRQNQGHVSKDAFSELLQLTKPLLPDPETDINCNGWPPDVRRLTAHVMDAFRGNRTGTPTYVRTDDPDETLRRLLIAPHSRFASRYTQELIRTRSIDEVLAAFDQAVADDGDNPIVHTHLGEVHLWVGNYEEARDAFLRSMSITKKVRWAYIGLCGSEMMLGRYDEGLKWCERGIKEFPPPGRTIYIYRGEIYRRTGELSRALNDFKQNEEITPGRLTGWINMALLQAERGDESQLVPTWHRTRDRAPGLVEEAVRERKPELDPTRPDPGDVAELFEHMIDMMRGNRSSDFVTYFTADSTLRFVPPPEVPDMVYNE